MCKNKLTPVNFFCNYNSFTLNKFININICMFTVMTSNVWHIKSINFTRQTSRNDWSIIFNITH